MNENLEERDKYIPELGGVWADNDLARETKKKLVNIYGLNLKAFMVTMDG